MTNSACNSRGHERGCWLPRSERPTPFLFLCPPSCTHTHTHKRQRVWSETGRRPARSLRTKRPPTSTYKRESSRTHPTRGTLKTSRSPLLLKLHVFIQLQVEEVKVLIIFLYVRCFWFLLCALKKTKQTCLKSILTVNMYIYHFILHTS